MNNYGEIIIYQTDDGLTKINVNMQEETVWLSLDQMAELFQRDKSTISTKTVTGLQNITVIAILKKKDTNKLLVLTANNGVQELEMK